MFSSSPQTFWRRSRIDAGFVLVVLLLLAFQLFVPPVLGVANDHDFEKILGRHCLGPVTAGTAYFDYTVYPFRFDPDTCIDWPMRTTNEGVFQVAFALDHTFYSKTVFDLRFIGIVYSLIFLTGFVSLQRALWHLPLAPSVIAQTAWIIVVCNAVYIPLFNTLYFDALGIATLTGALASIGVVALSKRTNTGWILVASLWLAILAGSKSQHAPLALLFLPALWIRPVPRRVIAAMIGSAAVIAGAWLSISTMPRFYQGEATFNALFYRVLPTVPNPAAYLSETRIPPSWAQYSGEVAFAEDVPLRDPSYEEQFGNWFGPVDLIRLYLRHPPAAWLIARENLTEASMDRVRIIMSGTPHRLGNYEESLGKPPQAISHFFAVWAALKTLIFSGRPIVYASWILAVIAVAWKFAPRVAHMPLLLGVVSVSLAVEFSICMLDGADGGRHLTLFCFLLDLVACCDIVFIAARFLKPAATSDKERSPS
jgi:hypothetical protein